MKATLKQIPVVLALFAYMALLGWLLFFVIMPEGFAGAGYAVVGVGVFMGASIGSVLWVKGWQSHALGISLFYLAVLAAGIGERGANSEWPVLLILWLIHGSLQCLFAVAANSDARDAARRNEPRH